MAVETLSEMPSIIDAGNTVRFLEGFSDYPATTHTAKAVIAAETPIVVDGTADDSNFLFVFTGVQTASIKPGSYLMTFYVYSGGEREIARTQWVRVRPDLSAVREPSAAEKMLKELDAVLEALAGEADFSSVSFNGQSFTKGSDTGSLKAWRVALQAEVIRERDELAASYGIVRDGRIDIVFAESGVR